MLSNKLHIVLIIAVVVYFLIILKLLKDKSLSLKYSLLWLLSGAFMGALVLFPNLLMVIVRLSGIQTPMYALLVLCIAFIMAILMSITSIVSRQNMKIRTLTQELAILEKRVRELELGKPDDCNI